MCLRKQIYEFVAKIYIHESKSNVTNIWDDGDMASEYCLPDIAVEYIDGSVLLDEILKKLISKGFDIDLGSLKSEIDVNSIEPYEYNYEYYFKTKKGEEFFDIAINIYAVESGEEEETRFFIDSDGLPTITKGPVNTSWFNEGIRIGAKYADGLLEEKTKKEYGFKQYTCVYLLYDENGDRCDEMAKLIACGIDYDKINTEKAAHINAGIKCGYFVKKHQNIPIKKVIDDAIDGENIY